MANTYKCEYDTNNTGKMGVDAEVKFEKIAVQRGWKFIPATVDEDRKEHWDCTISNGINQYKVDVKAMKRLYRYDKEPQDEWLWIELKGWGYNNDGWLYGKADIIAFEMSYGFLLVKRKDIKKVVLNKVDLTARVTNSIDAKYKTYKRHTGDLSTLIQAKDLEEVEHIKWKLK